MARRMPLSPSPGQDEVKSPERAMGLKQKSVFFSLIFHWLFSIDDFCMMFSWFFPWFSMIFYDFLWFFHHVLWFSMIFLSYPNLIMDITFPHLAGRTSMAQADIGSQETHDVQSQWFSYKSHYEFHLNLGWFEFVYRFHINLGVSKNRGTPKRMVYDGNPCSNWWFGGTIIFGNTHFIQIQWFHTNHFQIFGEDVVHSFWEIPMMWFTF